MASITTPERNWSGTYTYAAQQIYRPQTISELQRLIATGPSVAACARNPALFQWRRRRRRADHARRACLAGITIDEDARTVSVPAGIRYGDLARQLQDSGWAVSNLPSLPHISVAGSVATATHGSGNANQSLASAVTAVNLITGTGDQVRIDHTSPDFAGAVVHLGALGVVTELDARHRADVRRTPRRLRAPAMGSADQFIRRRHGRRLQRQCDHRLRRR